MVSIVINFKCQNFLNLKCKASFAFSKIKNMMSQSLALLHATNKTVEDTYKPSYHREKKFSA